MEQDSPKTFKIQNQRNYANATSFKKVLQSLRWHICGTHFLIVFLKLQIFQRFYFVCYLAPYLWSKVGHTNFPFENCIK